MERLCDVGNINADALITVAARSPPPCGVRSSEARSRVGGGGTTKESLACGPPSPTLPRKGEGRRAAPAFRQTLRRLVEQFPPDQHAADFAGAGSDLVELGVAQQSASRII